MVVAVLLLTSVLVNSSGNKVGVMFGSTERALCSLEMLGMLNVMNHSGMRAGQNCFLGCMRALC